MSAYKYEVIDDEGTPYPLRVRFKRMNCLMTSMKAIFCLIAFGFGGYTLFQCSLKYAITPLNQDSLNHTLGFGKIYALGMPDRYSRRDEMALLALTLSLDFTYVDAVSGEGIDNHSLPFRIGRGAQLNNGEIGCWRSHVSTWRRMLEDNIETALIIEDDIDFDVRIRTQVQRLLPNLNTLQKHRDESKKGWELVWLGACHEDAWRSDQGLVDKVISYRDNTVAPKSQTTQLFTQMLTKYNNTRNDTRILQVSKDPYCTVAYALTRRAAIKMLYRLTRELVDPLDYEIRRAMRELPLASYTVVPPLMQQWKIKNGYNSDLRDEGKGNSKWNPSIGQAKDVDLKFSARNSLRRTILAM